MENRDEPINPCLIKGRQGFADIPTIPSREVYGLTKREYFAGLAMQGFCSTDSAMVNSSQILAEWSVTMADALLKELKNG